jgi:hypothetical protein
MPTYDPDLFSPLSAFTAFTRSRGGERKATAKTLAGSAIAALKSIPSRSVYLNLADLKAIKMLPCTYRELTCFFRPSMQIVAAMQKIPVGHSATGTRQLLPAQCHPRTWPV